MNKEISTQFFDRSIRIEQLICIGYQILDESLPSDVKNAFNSDLDEIAAALGVNAEDLAEDYEEGDLAWNLRNKYEKQGYLVKFATPVPTSFSSDGSSCSFSWGYYMNQWIYGESLDECCYAALVWQTKFREDEKAKHLQRKSL